MANKIVACVLAATMAMALAAGGCGKEDKSGKDEKAEKGEKAGPAVSMTDKQIGDAQRQAAKFLADKGVSLESVQPGPEWKADPENPDEPKPTPMQQKFYRLRDGLTVRQVEQVMGGKAADTGELCTGGATYMAWNEGSRRFIVEIMNQRCMLTGSYDPKAPDSQYDKFQQVTVGMPKDQVRKLLGVSGKWMGSGLADVNGGTNVYDHGDNAYMIFFVDDKVAKIIK